ncbi:hypothetical protein CEXT_803811 [Caerostris extrusa]|uniref:Uncharacterized protein n=1 Tax=Caerostris extrusa TaxID=172846 RepID=A0AAV4Y0D5_CAEEX|nr:hypothetical protein CEXT_803811 [Caerostris extrusa]
MIGIGLMDKLSRNVRHIQNYLEKWDAAYEKVPKWLDRDLREQENTLELILCGNYEAYEVLFELIRHLEDEAEICLVFCNLKSEVDHELTAAAAHIRDQPNLDDNTLSFNLMLLLEASRFLSRVIMLTLDAYAPLLQGYQLAYYHHCQNFPHWILDIEPLEPIKPDFFSLLQCTFLS